PELGALGAVREATRQAEQLGRRAAGALLDGLEVRPPRRRPLEAGIEPARHVLDLTAREPEPAERAQETRLPAGARRGEPGPRALLDALGDLHLAFACEQLDRCCLAEIDAHRVGGARKLLTFLDGFLDGFRRRRTVAVLRGRQLRIVDLLVVDLDRQRAGLGRP